MKWQYFDIRILNWRELSTSLHILSVKALKTMTAEMLFSKRYFNTEPTHPLKSRFINYWCVLWIRQHVHCTLHVAFTYKWPFAESWRSLLSVIWGPCFIGCWQESWDPFKRNLNQAFEGCPYLLAMFQDDQAPPSPTVCHLGQDTRLPTHGPTACQLPVLCPRQSPQQQSARSWVSCPATPFPSQSQRGVDGRRQRTLQ